MPGRKPFRKRSRDTTYGCPNVENHWVIGKYKISYPNRRFEQSALFDALLEIEVVWGARNLHFDA